MIEMLRVVAGGLMTTIQDLGRPGYGHLGVSRSGAADRGALRLANRLVGNPDGHAALESTVIGPTLIAQRGTIVAVTGAPVAATIDGRLVDMNVATILPGGATLTLGTVRAGLRTYVAFAGGIDCDRAFASASTDTLSGLGPAPVASGTQLFLGPRVADPPPVDFVPASEPPTAIRVEMILGPRCDWLRPDSLTVLRQNRFVVAATSNRVGVRLDGPRLNLAKAIEMRSEGVIAGAMQVPPSGQPIILLADHPTTGGYPVVGCIPERELDRIAQLPPGGGLRFECLSPV